MSEQSKRKILNGKLFIYCKETNEWMPKFKTEDGMRWELDEKYLVYVLEGHSIDEARKAECIYEALFDYDLTPYYGLAREKYLKEEKYDLYLELKNKRDLQRHLVEIDIKANKMEDRLVEQFAEAEGVTEEIKEKDQMQWIGLMNNIIHRVREIVQNELIYV